MKHMMSLKQKTNPNINAPALKNEVTESHIYNMTSNKIATIDI